jgi:serine/threonine protein kinase, bacterial
MSYCLNPLCSHPENLLHAELCQACGSKLLLRDRYRILHALGQGGFGATFLARDEVLPGQPNCVIKQLRPTATAPHVLEMARELFKREAETLGRIGNHPQIPRLLDYFDASQEFYLVQEYISGATLQQEIKRSGQPFSEAGVKQFLSEVLPVLQYIHSHQVIHRDIKPANLIRRSHDCKLVLIDFGAVKNQVNTVAASLSEQTALTSYAIGTPGFAPPEQMAMRPVYASDIYALGVTCIYLLTGKSPKDLDYDPATGELVWQKQVQVSDHFASVLRKMLEVSVRHRYQNANDIFRALDLEPYLDSLANSMNSVNPKPGRRGIERSEPDSQPSSSPAARAAMAIRARQNRTDSTSLQSGAARNRVMAAKPAGTGTKNRDSSGRTSASGEQTKAPQKLDAQGLQSYYSKGKRDFVSYNLAALVLPRVNLSGAVFHQGNLSRINLQGANLLGTDFGRANLSRANLRDANMVKAYLNNADLEGADLRGADLSCAYLLNANLRGTNLCGANLTGAKLTPEQLATARTNWMTVRPSGKRGIW